MLFAQVVADDIVFQVANRRSPIANSHALADGDEFHLRGDDAGAGVSKLGDNFAGPGAQNLPFGQRALVQAVRRFVLTTRVERATMLFRQVTVVNRLDRAPIIFLDVTARANPPGAEGGQPLLDADLEIRVAPWTTRVVKAHRLTHFDPAIERFGGREFDLAHRHADVFVEFAGHIHALAVGQGSGTVRRGLGDASCVAGQASRLCYPRGLERIFGCNHNISCEFFRLQEKAGGSSLRQHYLEQVQRVSGAPAQDSQPLSRHRGTGWLPYGWRENRTNASTGQEVVFYAFALGKQRQAQSSKAKAQEKLHISNPK